jgi:hypothetical protein
MGAPKPGHAARSRRLPVVLFLDLDKTVIGRADSAVERFFLRKVLAELHEAGELPAAALPAAALDPAAEMAPLMRPGFGDAIRHVRRHIRHVEVFVCTMGAPATVLELKAPGIRAASGVALREPIFHRELCQSAARPDRKRVGACFRQAAATLAADGYPALRDPAAVDEVFRTRFFMIDDTPDVAFDDISNARLVTCPPFEGPRLERGLDVFRGLLPAAAMRNRKVVEYVGGRLANMTPATARDGPRRPATAADNFWPAFAERLVADAALLGLLSPPSTPPSSRLPRPAGRAKKRA